MLESTHGSAIAGMIEMSAVMRTAVRIMMISLSLVDKKIVSQFLQHVHYWPRCSLQRHVLIAGW